MTRQEFIEAWRHEIGGLILDAATRQSTGPELSLRLRHVLRHVDTLLGRIYADLSKEAPKAEKAEREDAPKTLPLTKKAT